MGSKSEHWVTQREFHVSTKELRDRFAEIAECFKKVDQRFEQVDQRFEQVDQRLEQVDQRLERIDQRFDRLEARLEEYRRYADVLHEELLHKLDLILEAFAPLAPRIAKHEERIEDLESDVSVLKAVVKKA